MDDYQKKCARMSNHSFIQELDEAAAILDDELKAISEVEHAHANTSVYVEKDFFEDNDDDDLTGELANLDSLAALQQELNMSALSFEGFNANNSKAYALEQQEDEEEAVITDVGEIRIGDAIMEEEACTTWTPVPSLSQDSSIHSATPSHFPSQNDQEEQRLPQRTVHRVVSRDGGEDIILTKQSSNDSEDISPFQTSPHGSPRSAVRLMRRDRLDITLSPIRFTSDTDENQDVPSSMHQSTQQSNFEAGFRNILVDATPSMNVMDTKQSQDVTPKIQNTRTGSAGFQFQDDGTGHFANENHDELVVSEKAIGAPTHTTHISQPSLTEEPSPMSSLLNTLLASPEPLVAMPNSNVKVDEQEQDSKVGVLATSASESSSAGESHSFSSPLSEALTSNSNSEVASVSSSASSVSTVSASSSVSSSSVSMSSTQSTDKKKWNPIRLFNQKNASAEEKARNSIFTKPSSSKSKKKKSKSKARHRFISSPNLPTVSEDKTLAPTQAPPSNITVSQPHDPHENEIRETLGMDGGRRKSLFQDNKERVALNRMMKMLMEQRNKNKSQEKRERKLLHMLCDARNDRKELIDENDKVVQDLQRKLKSSFENNEILRQENELLLMQTDAWKEISRQSNQTAALYKYTFDERKGKPRYDAPVGETMNGGSMELAEAEDEDELVQVKREKEELENKLTQLQKDSHLEKEGLKYQTELLAQELEQSQTLFEDKLENYIQENAQLKDDKDVLRRELEERYAAISISRKEVQDLQLKSNSTRPKMHAEIINLRVHKLEDQFITMQNFHRSRMVQSNQDKAITEARIKSLEISVGNSAIELRKAEEGSKALRDQLSLERKSRSQSTRIFQQQSESLMDENESLKKEILGLQGELASTRTDQVQIEAELLKERKEVHRLQKQAEDEAQLITELQEELDNLQTNFEDAESEAFSTDKAAKSPEAALNEAQDTLENEIQAAENVALRVQVERLKLELKSKSPLTPRSSYRSSYKSPVERRVRDQVLRLRKSLTPKQQYEEPVASTLPRSPFFTDSPSVTLTGHPNSLKSTSPKKFASMLRPKGKGSSMPPRRLDKENNTFMSPQKRRGGGLSGLSTRTGLGIR
ncbi:unnamed protein product [Cylindrotheca closterium]|uniref:Uncharacterized protein n=1 Tax=Cylindrotheca closterium TaxID=2856 RepID=A0AAD2CLM8_9STRA|nr:unnamed protein product [Cylindrotheca closterium]